MLDEEALVADGLVADVAEEEAVLLELADVGGAGAEDAGPEAGEEVGVGLLLLGGLADDGAGEVEEVAVDGLEEGEEGDGVLELAGDGLLEDGEELVEELLDEALLALGVGGAEDEEGDGADGGGGAGGVLEDVGGREDAVDVVVGRGQGRGGRGGGEAVEVHARPVHDVEDAVDVAVDAGEEARHLEGQRLHGVAEGVEVGDDAVGVAHAAGADALAQVPHGHARGLQVLDLGDGVLRVVDEGLEGAGHAGHLDQVAGRQGRGGLDEGAEGPDEEDEGEDDEGDGGPRRGRDGPVVAEEGDGRLYRLRALLNLCPDGEADI